LVAAGAIAAAIGGTPMAVLRFAVGHGTPDALPLELAAPVLRVLAVAHAATAMAALGTTIVAAAGKSRLAALLAGSAAVLATIGAAVAGDLAPELNTIGVYVAIGLGIGILAGAVVIIVAVARTVGPFVRALTLVRVSVALAAAMIAGAYIPIPGSRLLAMLLPTAPLAIYVAVVAVLGERLQRT
jgi:hypothetical protein